MSLCAMMHDLISSVYCGLPTRQNASLYCVVVS